MNAPDLPPCPKCHAHDFKVLKLPHPLLLHWILNPGLVINEVLLGQRIPRETLVCRNCDLPAGERSYVQCPGCRSLHDGRIWRGRLGFGNWLGLVCPTCGERIPCLWNLTSLALLTVTAPLWYLPVRYYRTHAVPERPPLTLPPPVEPRRFLLRAAIGWGSLMFIFMTLLPALRQVYLTGRMPWPQLVAGAAVWTLGGLAFGWILSRITMARRKVATQA